MAEYLICRMENYKMNQAIGVDHEKEHSEEHGYNNPDWDKTKTHENVILEHDPLKDGKTFPEYIKTYREENNIQGRLTTSGKEKSQTNVLTQCIVTASPDFFKNENREEHNQFFKDGLQAFKNMYPSYHIVDAVIHYDESSPHLHINALPIYYNTNKNILQFSTTETQKGKYHYREFQDHMYKEISRNWQIDRGVQREEKTHLTKKEWLELSKKEKELLEKERSLSKKEESVKKYEERPEPQKTIFTKKDKYKKEDVDKLIEERNTLYAKLDQKESQNKQLESDLSYQRYKYQELDINFSREHKDFLELQEKQHDREYLKQQIKEIEHLHDLDRFHTHNRDDIAIGGR